MGRGIDTIYLDYSNAFDYVSTSPVGLQTAPLGYKGTTRVGQKSVLQIEELSMQQQHMSFGMIPCCVGCTTRNDSWTSVFPDIFENDLP